MEVALGGKSAREVVELELIACFFEGVFTGVGKARSAEEREDWRAEIAGREGCESEGGMREEDEEEEDAWLYAVFLGEGFTAPGDEGERLLLVVPLFADVVGWFGGGVV